MLVFPQCHRGRGVCSTSLGEHVFVVDHGKHVFDVRLDEQVLVAAGSDVNETLIQEKITNAWMIISTSIVRAVGIWSLGRIAFTYSTEAGASPTLGSTHCLPMVRPSCHYGTTSH